MALAGRPDPRVRPPYCQVWVSAASDSSLSTSRVRDLDPFRGEQGALHAAGAACTCPGAEDQARGVWPSLCSRASHRHIPLDSDLRACPVSVAAQAAMFVTFRALKLILACWSDGGYQGPRGDI